MPNITTNHAITYTSLENEQLFTQNTKILRIVLFSLIHNEMTEARQESISQLITSSLIAHWPFPRS